MSASQDADMLRPGDPGFAGFPNRLPEDTVSYEIRLLDEGLSDAGVREKLRQVQQAATQLTRKHLRGYIWQRDSFNLELKKESGT